MAWGWGRAGDAQPSLSAAGGDDNGGVEQAVAETLWFAACEVAVEGEQPSPGEQVLGDERDLEPCLVDGELPPDGDVVHHRRTGRERLGTLRIASAAGRPQARPLASFELLAQQQRRRTSINARN